MRKYDRYCFEKKQVPQYTDCAYRTVPFCGGEKATARRKRRKKRIALFICTALFTLFAAVLFPVLSYSLCGAGEEAKSGKDALNENIYGQIGALDLEELQKYADEIGVFDGESVSERIIAYIGGDSFSYGDFFTQMKALFFKDVQDLLPAFASIAAITLLGGVVAAIGNASGGVGNISFLVLFSAALLPVLVVMTQCFTAAKSALESMNRQIQIVFPILLTLMSVSGGTVSAAIYTPAVAFLSTGAIALILNVLLPLSVTIVAFSVAGNLSPELKLNKFSAFFRSMNKWLIGVCVSVFGLFFTAQGIGAATYDGIVRRAAKYAIGTGVPIIGGFLSGGFDLAVAGSALIKDSVGYLAMILLLAVVFKPLILLIASNLLFRFTAAVSQPLGESRISDFLSETADNINLVLAALLMAAFLYFVMLLLCVFASRAAL